MSCLQAGKLAVPKSINSRKSQLCILLISSYQFRINININIICSLITRLGLASNIVMKAIGRKGEMWLGMVSWYGAWSYISFLLIAAHNCWLSRCLAVSRNLKKQETCLLKRFVNTWILTWTQDRFKEVPWYDVVIHGWWWASCHKKSSRHYNLPAEIWEWYDWCKWYFSCINATLHFNFWTVDGL